MVMYFVMQWEYFTNSVLIKPDIRKKMFIIWYLISSFFQEEIEQKRHIGHSVKEVTYNPKYDELYAPQVCWPTVEAPCKITL